MMQQGTTPTKVSMRHLYLYTCMLLDQASKQGRKVRLQWAPIKTASIAPDPNVPEGLLITLPEMATLGTEEDAILLRALIAHEVLCHGHHTDFSVIPDEGIGGALENVLEDPRGELRALPKFPGSKTVIREGIEVLVKRGIFKGPPADGKLHPADILTSWLVTELRSELLGQSCLEGFSVAYRKLALQTFGSKLTAAVKAEALSAARAPTTGDVQISARRILELLRMAKDNPPPPPPPPQDGEGDPEEGDQGQQSEEEQGAGPGDSDEPQGSGGADDAGSDHDGDEPGDQPGEEPGDQDGHAGGADQSSEGDQPGESGQPGDGSSNEQGEQGAGDNAAATPGQGSDAGNQGGFEPDHADLASVISAVLDASKDDAGDYAKGLEDHLVEGNEAMKQAAYGGSHTHEMREVPAPTYGSIDNRETQRKGARSTAAQLSLRMEELLEAKHIVRRRASTEGALRQSRIWRVGVGDLNVHVKRSRTEEINTCVKLLTDESISMDAMFGDMRRKEAATRVAVAAGEVLTNADVAFSLSGYNTSMRDYQDFEGDWAQTLQRYRPHADSSTNTHLAVVREIRRFVGRTEDRKILGVITDGDPGDEDVLLAALEIGEELGVEVVFILISNENEHIYRRLKLNYGVANTPNELAKAVFGCLEAALA